MKILIFLTIFEIKIIKFIISVMLDIIDINMVYYYVNNNHYISGNFRENYNVYNHCY